MTLKQALIAICDQLGVEKGSRITLTIASPTTGTLHENIVYREVKSYRYSIPQTQPTYNMVTKKWSIDGDEHDNFGTRFYYPNGSYLLLAQAVTDHELRLLGFKDKYSFVKELNGLYEKCTWLLIEKEYS